MEKLKDMAIVFILLIGALALYQVFVANSNLRAALKTLEEVGFSIGRNSTIKNPGGLTKSWWHRKTR